MKLDSQKDTIDFNFITFSLLAKNSERIKLKYL